MTLIVAAMQEEVSEILKVKSETYDVLVTGVGKVNAAMKLAEYLSKLGAEYLGERNLKEKR